MVGKNQTEVKSPYKDYALILQIDFPVKARNEDEAEKKGMKEWNEIYGFDASFIGIVRPEGGY